ncbi:MAG: FimB/Mfa2 family fimbrial subunit [Candidatus Cryptobacteroides sp.]
MSLFLFIVLQSFITCPGCSMKEDRDQCPCILKIVYAEDDVEMLGEGVGVCLDEAEEGRSANEGRSLAERRSLEKGRGSGGELNVEEERGSGGELNAEEERGNEGELNVEERLGFDGERRHLDSVVTIISGLEVSLKVWRGGLDVLSLYPADAERLEEDGECWFRIKEGSSCPEIWTAHSMADTRSDRAVVNCDLRKNHCRIRISFNGTGSYTIRIRGNVCGYGYDGKPYPGSFHADAEAVGDGSLQVCVPRQKDNSLMLDLISGDGGIRSFAIGNYLAESGYDWSSDDLQDATITIDYAATSVTFSIDKWSRTVHFETVI